MNIMGLLCGFKEIRSEKCLVAHNTCQLVMMVMKKMMMMMAMMKEKTMPLEALF